jgi:serine/threonine-protein kinase
MSVTPVPSGAPELTKFELLDEIGHGGMATVYRARDVRLGREVAVKLIHPHLRENKEVAARFVAEARAVAKLRHPGIVEVFDVSDADDRERYLVAELVRGPSLRKLLVDHPEIPAEVGACFGVLLSDALAHAHDAGIVHRDVKPENVLVELDAARATAAVKLTDFGIAKILDAQSVTSTGQVLGSPAHMAPEQIEGGAVDVRTDVFSLGVLIYECMAGRLPFEGKNPAQVLKKVLECCHLPPDRHRPKVGARWSAILARAIAREPSERYADIRAFGEAMRAELAELGIEDARAEIYRFLSDPGAYDSSYTPALVGALIARAQRARRVRDIQQAAADLNRAVAYRPNDADLLRQVNTLAQGQWRRLALRRAAAALAAVLTLGVVMVLAGRALKRTADVPVIVPVEPTAERAVEPTAPVATSSQAPNVLPSAPRAFPSVRIPHIVPIRPPVEARERPVLITASPHTAYVSIDRGPSSEVGQKGKRVSLAVGRHTFYFTASPSSSSCCEPQAYDLLINPDDGSGTPQVVYGKLKARPARLTLTGAPADGRLVCATRNVNLGNGSQTVEMTQFSEMVSCIFSPLGTGRSVPLTAGGEVVVAWPAGP